MEILVSVIFALLVYVLALEFASVATAVALGIVAGVVCAGVLVWQARDER